MATSLVELGDELRRQGDRAGAAEAYSQAARVAPEQAEAFVRLGRLHLAGGDPHRAEVAFRDARERGGDPAATVGLADALTSVGRAAEAEELLRPLAERQGGATVWRALGLALDRQGRHGDAQLAYRRGLADAPQDDVLSGNLGLSLLLSGDRAESLALLTRVALAPGARPVHLHNLVLALGVFDRAEEARRIAGATLAPAATEELLARGRALRDATDPADRAALVGLAPGP